MKIYNSKGTSNAQRIILVLDDDEAVRSSLKFSLGVEGFEVRIYADCDELLNEESFPERSCLVVDYRMPKMDGLELVARLRARRISIPAILMTAHQSEDLRRRAGAAGVPVVEKPFLGGQLLERIRQAFDNI
jgi:FixJ family two-component response regulator